MSFPMSSVPAIIQPVYPAAALSVRGKKKVGGGIIIMMMIETVIKSSACVFFRLPASYWLSSAGCPCSQRSSWRLQTDFFFFNFPRISNRSAEPLDGIQNGAGGRRGGEKPRN